MTESQLQEAVAEYLVRFHPSVMFHSDFGSGTKLTKFQAIRQMRQNGGRKGWPDLFIAEPKDGYAGLFLELKKRWNKAQKEKWGLVIRTYRRTSRCLGRIRVQGLQGRVRSRLR